MNGRPHTTDRLTQVRLGSLLAGVVGGLLCLLGWYFFPQEFYPAYLVAFLFWLGVALGGMAIVMIHHLTGGGWGLPIRRILEASFANLVLMALLFLPLIPGLPVLYPWARPDEVEHDEILQLKQPYLNVDFFLIRAAVYFAVWILTALMLYVMSSGTRLEDEPVRQRRLSLFSGPGLVLWALAVTFASVDWAMSLDPHWFSSMYGVLFMGGQGVSGLAFAIIAAAGLARTTRSTAATYLTRDRLNDLGNLLLAFVMFWSYVSFMQFLIIWSGNLPEETPWYLDRLSPGWKAVAGSLIVLHFLVPFLLLLYRQTKRRPIWLVSVCALLLLMRFVDLTWLVMPTFHPEGLQLSWLNFVTPIAIGGLWLAVFTWRLPARLELPVHQLPDEEAAHGTAQHAH